MIGSLAIFASQKTNSAAARRRRRTGRRPATSPRVLAVGAELGGQQQPAGGDGDQRRARVVDLPLDLRFLHVQHGGDHDQRDGADRQVHVEDPAPAADPEQVSAVGEEAADQRADDHGEHEGRGEVALVLAPLGRADDLSDDREDQRHQAAAAEALQRAEGDQLVHVLRHAAQGGADQEDQDGEDEDLFRPVEVGELAVDRGDRRRGEQVRGDHPGHLGRAVRLVQVVDDRQQRGGDDGLVQRGQQQGQHQAAEDDHDLPVRHLLLLGLGLGRRYSF
jgi:hypothetical protein